MDTVEVSLSGYKFLFRQLRWREEFNIKFDPAKDRLRTILSYALDEVSGIKVASIFDAERVLSAIPPTVIYRIFLIYKGKLPQPRIFTTIGLYKAPEPNRMIKKLEEAEAERDQIMDRVEREMEAKFGRRELKEAKELELQMFRNSKGRGVVAASSDEPLIPPEKK